MNNIINPKNGKKYSIYTKAGENILPVPINDDRWRKAGHGGVLLPQDHGTDGMSLFCWEIR